MSTPAVRTVIVAATLLLGTGAAWGHAFLERAEPRVGSTIRTVPTHVRVWFTENLEPAFSTLEVWDTHGKRVDGGAAEVTSASPAMLRVSVRSLGPGTYRVKWRVLSVDTHVTEGDFTFRIAP